MTATACRRLTRFASMSQLQVCWVVATFTFLPVIFTAAYRGIVNNRGSVLFTTNSAPLSAQLR